MNTREHTPKPLLVGIILDVSNSMRRNWRNEEGEELPRIEVIRDVLNKHIRRLAILRGSQETRRSIDVFCLGMGFRKTDVLCEVRLENEHEATARDKPQTVFRVDVVCDLLALADHVPSRTALNQLRNELNKKWNDYAQKSLNREYIDDDIYEQLRSYIEASLHDSAHRNLRRSIDYRAYVKLKGSKIGHTNQLARNVQQTLDRRIKQREKGIETLSYQRSVQFLDDISKSARRIFDEKRSEYEKYIERMLLEFVNKETATVLDLMTVGYGHTVVLNYFNETKALDLATTVYRYLYDDVTRSMARVWMQNRSTLTITQRHLRAKIDFRAVRELTEKCVQKYGWSVLSPFVRKVVFDMFERSFESKAKEKINDWIGFSSRREVTRPLSQVVNILPETFAESVYSERYMFGSTPIRDAIHLATARMLDRRNRNRAKILVIVSDGEFEHGLPSCYTDLLKQSGVSIISCCVVNRNLVSSLVARISPNWPVGAQLLFDAASIANADDVLVQRLKQQNIELPENNKLFIQLNHSETLGAILEALMEIQDSGLPPGPVLRKH